MKTCLRIPVTASAAMFLVIACSLAFAGDTGNAKARAALALSAATKAKTEAKGGCGCSCAERGCNCAIPGECGDPGCCCGRKAKSPGPIEWAIYEAQYNKALKANKPLLIWVGETCPSCESRWTEYVHARLSEYDGKNGTETGPEVILARPDGLGGMTIAGRLDGIPAKTAVDGLLNPAPPPRPVVQFAPRPIPMMMPMMPMGGFGGGMMGGFGVGGGGSC